ncbi:MAG: histidinol dehydrogenase [Acidobacteria bacterium]|nr:histidinol dehydrogenase [Acidobacteriota bacterium]
MRTSKVGSRRGERELERLVRRARRVIDRKTLRVARRIVNDVRRKGDRALLDAVREHDGFEADRVADLRMPLWREPVGDAGGGVEPAFRSALEEAIAAVDRFHAPQVHPGYVQESDGVWLEERRRPLSRVGIYVPGGRFPYPSTVLMTVIPARLAGVEEIVVVTPPRTYRESPALRYTLSRLEVQEIWGMGGAQAVAALAYGTESIRRVDKILGPGSVWVTAAKQIVAGDVAIDGVPGPTEVLIFADSSADEDLVAADLLAQAEHDPQAASVLLTPDGGLARRVAEAIERQLESLKTAAIARESIKNFGCTLIVRDLEEGLEIAERIAPEHLQLVGEGPESLADRVRSAGAVFVGASTPEVFGDYVAGPSHVLPTCGTARFASALGVEDFIRRSHCIRFTEAAARRWAPVAESLAEVEGLEAHAAAARRRRT